MKLIDRALSAYNAKSNRDSVLLAQKAIELGGGEINAYIILAWAHEKGVLVPQNDKLALEYYEKSADIDSKNGQYALADYYRRHRDIQKAFIHYLKAADSGSLPGAYNVALCYQSGAGGGVDKEKAEKYFKWAAQRQHIFSRVKIAKKYIRSSSPTKIITGLYYLVWTPIHTIFMVLTNRDDERVYE